MLNSILVWVLFTVCSIAVTLFAMIFSPLLALFVSKDGYYPLWLDWFQTPDNPAVGDESFHKNQMSWTTSNYLYALFWQLRNPAYGFDSFLGHKLTSTEIKIFGDKYTSNMPLHNGWVFYKLNQNNITLWQLYIVIGWSQTRCFRVNLGWKLWGNLQLDEIRPVVFSILPWAKCIQGN